MSFNFSTEATNANSSSSGQFYAPKATGVATIPLLATDSAAIAWPLSSPPTAGAVILLSQVGADLNATATRFYATVVPGATTFVVSCDAAPTVNPVTIAYAVLSA